MDKTLAPPETINRTARWRIEGILLLHPLGNAGSSAYRREPGALPLKSIEGRASCFAPRHRPFEHRVEHRHEVAGRTVDDPQHLGGRRLLVERFARFGQEPRILHRDHRLSREIPQQRNLLVRKRAHLVAISGNSAEQRFVLSQGHDQLGTDTADFDKGTRQRIIRSPRREFGHVVDLSERRAKRQLP